MLCFGCGHHLVPELELKDQTVFSLYKTAGYRKPLEARVMLQWPPGMIRVTCDTAGSANASSLVIFRFRGSNRQRLEEQSSSS